MILSFHTLIDADGKIFKILVVVYHVGKLCMWKVVNIILVFLMKLVASEIFCLFANSYRRDYSYSHVNLNLCGLMYYRN